MEKNLVVDVMVKGLCYEDLCQILVCNGYDVCVYTEHSNKNASEVTHKVKAWLPEDFD